MALKTVRQGIDIGSSLLGEYVNDAYKLHLESHENDLECRASIEVYDTSASISPADLLSLLRKHEINELVDLEQVAIFCSDAALGENPENVLLARGTAAENGENGWFELVVTTGREEALPNEDESGRIDFKSIQTFSNVEPGQTIGNIYPPTSGKPGKTIYGVLIEAVPGRVCTVIPGNGVHITEDGSRVIADQAGRVIFENNVLSVSEEFVVNGDVDLNIGHISFNGFVDIKGDVLDDFNISASKGIKVSGAVGACRIVADGPISVGTMAGLGRGEINCRGSLQAKYLNQVKVECRGDITIFHEARNSTLKATGSVQVPQGLITGGETVALEGIEAKILGSRSGTRTTLTSGVYFPEADRLGYLRARLKSLTEQLKRIKETLRVLHAKPIDDMRRALREAIELRIGILTQRQVNLDQEREEVGAELQQFSLQEHPTANPKINVNGAIKAGVFITLGETTEEVPATVSAPASIIEETGGGLRYLTYSPLPVSAAEAEQQARGEAERQP